MSPHQRDINIYVSKFYLGNDSEAAVKVFSKLISTTRDCINDKIEDHVNPSGKVNNDRSRHTITVNDSSNAPESYLYTQGTEINKTILRSNYNTLISISVLRLYDCAEDPYNHMAGTRCYAVYLEISAEK